MATAHAVTLIKTRQPMKTYSSIRHTIALLAASLLLVTPSLISAQDANRQGGQGQGQGRRGGGGGAFANMSEEQRAAMQEVNQEVREQSRAVNEARTELNNAIYAEKMDEAKIREKSAALAKLEADLAVARAKAFAKVRGKFTSEQIEALKSMQGGGRGGGGGRRQGGAN